MKFSNVKTMLIVSTSLTILLSACGARPVPTVDPAQVQASAIAAANTMVAMTQAAMPTETPIPPTAAATDTPQPSPTIPPIDTLPVLGSPTVAPASTSSGDDCKILSVSKGEKKANILFNNKTNVLMGVSFYLVKNAFGDCGYWSTQVKPHDSVFITNLPTGNYYIGTWTLSGKPDFQNLGYPFSINTQLKYTINATTETIYAVP